MDKFLYYLKKVFSLSPRVVINQILQKISEQIRNIYRKQKDIFLPQTNSTIPPISHHYVTTFQLNTSALNSKAIEYYIRMYLAHRIDLLGSGWIKIGYNIPTMGVEGIRYNSNVEFNLDEILLPTHRKCANRVFKLIDDDYIPIDWQMDFKSGYRFSAKRWYHNYAKFHLEGVDAKVPWELSRFQHMVRLGLFVLKSPGYAQQAIREFRNQALDFIATNPPRFGINWTCTMEVAIRAANLLLAYDIFTQLDKWNILNDEFKQIFANSIYQHGKHIVENLEWFPELTSNHYLANIAGLLFISAYLENSDEINTWLAFCVQEIINEFRKQFHEDGSNFEASTAYHRLSAEFILFSVALILGLPEDKINALKSYNRKLWRKTPKLLPPNQQEYKIIDNKVIFPDWFIDRLYRAGRFAVDITKPTSRIVQIGDNDSGRFFTLSPIGEFITNKSAEQKYFNLRGYCEHIKEYDKPDGPFWDEDILNHLPFISLFSGLFDDKIFDTGFTLEKSIIESLAKHRKLKPNSTEYKLPICFPDKDIDLPYVKTLEFPADDREIPLTTNLSFIPYPDFGLYIFKSARLYLAIFAGPVGQNDNGGHSHNDKLSVELTIDGKDVLRDPGTYLYTPLPYRRNEFRSVKSHNTLIVDNIEQNDWFVEGYLGLFSIKPQTNCKVISFDKNSIKIKLEYKDIIQIREIKILQDKVIIIDRSNKEFVQNIADKFSPGYGKLINLSSTFPAKAQR